MYFKNVFLFLFFLISFGAFAQKWEVGIGLGATQFRGDLNPELRIQNSRPALSLCIRDNFSRVSTLKYGIKLGLLTGNDNTTNRPFSDLRQLSFESNFADASVMYEYNFFNFRHDDNYLKLSPYLTGGLSLGYHSKAGLVAGIPFGGGIKFQISKNWNLGAAMITTKAFSDQLDGISDQSDRGLLLGDVDQQDWFISTFFVISYTFYNVICPDEMEHNGSQLLH